MLKPFQRIEVDLNADPLIGSEDLWTTVGIEGKAVAEIVAGGKSFLVVDSRDSVPDRNRSFYIIDHTFSYNPKRGLTRGYKGLKPNEEVPFGRVHHTERFVYPPSMRNHHFQVTYKLEDDGVERILIDNFEAENATLVTAHNLLQPEQRKQAARQEIEALYTYRAVEHVRDLEGYKPPDEHAPYGYYKGYPILGRMSKHMEGGVYLGWYAGGLDAILIDGSSPALRELYAGLRQEFVAMVKGAGRFYPNIVHQRVKDLVRNIMPYDLTSTEQFSKTYMGEMVGLSEYVKNRFGVCRQQALTVAYLEERLIADGFLHGTAGFERNADNDIQAGHMWAVNKTSDKPADLTVIDPAQDFVGTKALAETENRWRYLMPADPYELR